MLPRRRADRAPHRLAARTPAALLVPALVRNLAEVVDGTAVYVEPSGAVIASWPPLPPGRVLGEDLAAVAALPGMSGVEPVSGGGGVLVSASRLDERDRAVWRETAAWLGVAARLDRLRADRDRAATRAARLSADLRAARTGQARVRDLEQRRLVGSITTVAGRGFDDVRARAARLRDAFGSPEETRAVEDLRDALDELIDAFRTVVRGVHPAMLPERGPRAALEELAAVLRRPVRFSGDLGRRVGWEVESGLYHACAAVLNLVATSDNATPVGVVFAHRDGVLRVEVTAPGWPWPVDRLRADLADDAARLAVLGGALDCAVTDGVAEVRVRLPERIGPVGTTAEPESSLLDRVRHLVEQGWHAAADRAPWEALADRLGQPPRLVVVGPGSAEVAGALTAGRPASLRGLTVTEAPGPVDQAMATALTEVWSADAVLCLTAPPPEFRLLLRAAAHRVDVVEAPVRPALALFAATAGEDGYRALRRVPPEAVGGLSGDDLRVAADAARVADGPGGVAEELAQVSGLVALADLLTRRLVARADLIAARRALVSITRMASGPLLREVDRVRVHAHEIVELDTLDDIERDPSLPPGVRAEGERLMGLHGVEPRVRLGLAADASDDEVRSAARSAAGRWRVLGEVSGRVREVCEVVVRTCEGLISAAPGR
ncbi:hypothetical protein Q5530_27575 [Saccharothrix sp. BKS2]|uniref:hypothetical protein n=1 Tax=Saccharothrix sp. BKS2 TaxID=3064400 RepID=UPI0039ECD9A1